MDVRVRPRITPTNATLGAVVTDVDLSALDAPAWRTVEDAFHEFGVLIFPGQNLSPDAQVAFGERFGRIEELVAGYKAVPITNKKRDGSLLRDDEDGMQIQMGNEGWHTDSSYMRISAKASILAAHVVPSRGGQTEWADMRAAYDALDDATRERIEPLSAFHSLVYSQAQIGHSAKIGSSYGLSADTPPLRPLVKTHPVTGRKALYIGRHAYGIPGLEPEESKQLLADLVAFACQPPRTYLHQWQAGDVVIWDNRCLLHRARPYDHGEHRAMMHVRVSGDPVTELAANA
ncbi:MAG TPA: TauD/TfdA family dioxygenase [Caulobacteraceae bacterium]|jgi:alpha-ketoglutarate-dependent taurine dioxygenase|nr:TauD/TfdA family dioxygenase [Caulobacteraceae bacterium]